MAASILEVTSVGSLLGEEMLNRWHFVSEDGTGVPTDVLGPFVTEVLGPYKTQATPDTQWTALKYRIITDLLAPSVEYPISPILVGDNASESEASFLAATIRWAPGTTVILSAEVPQRRVRRGGKRLGGLSTDSVTGNQITTGSRAGWELVAEGYLGMSDGGWIPCIAGFEVMPVPRPHPLPAHYTVPNKYALITGYSLAINVGSQVSRKAGHGA